MDSPPFYFFLPTIMYIKFDGNKIRRLRKEKGLTLEEVSKATKMTITQLSRIENNIVGRYWAKTAKKLSSFFKVPLENIITLTDEV